MATLIEICKPGQDSRGPIVRRPDRNVYAGYFQSCHGDHWVFTFDYRAERGELRGSDVGWEAVYEIEDGVPMDLILSPEESTWLRECWNAATNCRTTSQQIRTVG
jgi:hypothetical protein